MKNQGKGFKKKKEFYLYVDKHSISCPRSTLKQDKVDIVAAHIARSVVNDAMNNEVDDVEDEESDEEYIDDVVLEEIGDDSDETPDTAQQSEKDKMTVRVTMTARITTIGP